MAAVSDVPMESEEEESSHDEDEDEERQTNAARFGVAASVDVGDTLEPPGDRLGFSLNGHRVPLLPGGGAPELRLHFHPGGSSSGFVSVRVAGAPSDSGPVITGVLSDRAAHNVVKEQQKSGHKSSPSPKAVGKLAPGSKKYIPKGPARPFKCAACSSQYRLISELRGFICLCSPAVTESVAKLKMIRKKKNDKKRHRNRSRKSGKESVAGKDLPVKPAAPAGVSAASSPRPPAAAIKASPGPAAAIKASPGPASPQLIRPEPDRGKLVIMVDDFYYGRDPGRGAAGELGRDRRGHAAQYRCLHCAESLHSNIQLMCHLKTHAAKTGDEDRRHTGSPWPCPHCFRRFGCAFTLQCHVEAVHTPHASAAKCEICELHFASEPLFLQHMKRTHKAGEMPYVCQVCDFRSSFYSDVWSHFEEFHADSKNLMCPYCLKVLRSSSCYMQHFSRHQRKFVFSCKKCRLHFLFVKEVQQHDEAHHRSHITPTQLTGLKPGTKVTVRTYSVVPAAKCEEAAGRAVVACKVVDVEAAAEIPPKKPRESVAHLLSNLSSDEDAADSAADCSADARRPPRRCLECLKRVGKLSRHFPSLVRCSLCAFATCCSNAYANHMIIEHTAARTSPHYRSMFRSHARSSATLSCARCPYVSRAGDEMAAHLAERPGHVCVTAPGASGTHAQPICHSHSPPSERRMTSSAGGAFAPIGLAPPRQLSLKALASPYEPPSPTAMTIKFLRPRPQTAQEQPAQESHLLAEWEWRVATWVLIRHEQQLHISEDVLLQTGARVPPDGEAECYRRAARRLCRHLRPGRPADTARLPQKVLDMLMEESAAFVLSLCSRIRCLSLRPAQVGFMDELPVFVDGDLFAQRSGRAFRLQGWPAQAPLLEVVLSALSDGTFLMPVLFFRGAPLALPAGFPDNVLLASRRDGFGDARRLQVWTNKVWRPRVWPGRSLLIADIHRGHEGEAFKTMLSAASTDAVFIPAGCSCRLQPLDVCVKPVLLNFLQVRWKQLVANGGLDGLSLEQLALMMACWLSEVSSTLAADAHILRRSFAAVCQLQREQTDAEELIRSLTAKLNVPLEVAGPDPDPGPPAGEVKLLLVVHREQQQQKMDSDGEQPKMS